MDRDSGVASGTNQLLAALPPDISRRLMRSLSPIFLEVRTVLFEPGGMITSVEFPRNCVVSLVTPLEDGTVVEVASVGNEGIVGVPLVQGGSLAVRAVCAVEGWADRIDAATFREEVERDARLRELVGGYLQALFGQISQATACNRLHSNKERLSRWLLMSHDRVGADEFAITHEFLSQMLGSRRAAVSLTAGILESAGLITYHRGRVAIVDRAGLESVACECYRVIERELHGVVQRAWRRSPVPGASTI